MVSDTFECLIFLFIYVLFLSFQFCEINYILKKALKIFGISTNNLSRLEWLN